MGLLPQDPKERKYILLGLKIAGDFGASIAIPAVIFVLIGQWLDDKYAKGPWFTVLGFVLAALVSARIIYKKAKEYGREYQNIDKNHELGIMNQGQDQDKDKVEKHNS